jgi:hypothetical protein
VWLRWTAANKFTTSIETQEIDPEIVTPKPKQKKGPLKTTTNPQIVASSRGSVRQMRLWNGTNQSYERTKSLQNTHTISGGGTLG